MWKILLVEDEPYVRRSIRNAIPWEESGFSVVAEASHGLEALELMEELDPDIVITDIFMPYMDGIELLQTARSKGKEAAFIMLTCANDFEHARMALEYGAASYIFKLSMDDNDLLRALSKVEAQLEKRADSIRKERSRFQDCLYLLWRRMLGKELTLAENQRLEEFRQAQQQYGQLYIVASLTGSHPIGYDSLMRMCGATLPKADMVLSLDISGQQTWFMWSEQTDQPPLVWLDAQYGETELVGKRVRMGVAIEQEWLEVLRRLDHRFYGCERQGNGRELEKLTAGAMPAIPWSKEQEVIRAFEGMKIAECEKGLTELWRFMEGNALPMPVVKETALRLDLIMSRISRKQALPTLDLTRSVRHRELLVTLIARMQQYSKGMSKHNSPVTDHPEVNKMIAYLQQNYDQDISLQAMAQYVSMDENYLSGLFKKKTGISFINYLQKIRVEEAKFLLAHTDLTVNELCERAGFANPSYFFKIFKRWTGLTPNEYRTANKQTDSGV